jgi:hypothetical protein
MGRELPETCLFASGEAGIIYIGKVMTTWNSDLALILLATTMDLRWYLCSRTLAGSKSMLFPIVRCMYTYRGLTRRRAEA